MLIKDDFIERNFVAQVLDPTSICTFLCMHGFFYNYICSLTKCLENSQSVRYFQCALILFLFFSKEKYLSKYHQYFCSEKMSHKHEVYLQDELLMI